jgi:hypothetical protein
MTVWELENRYLRCGYTMGWELRHGELYLVLTGPRWVGGPVGRVLTTLACRPERTNADSWWAQFSGVWLP